MLFIYLFFFFFSARDKLGAVHGTEIYKQSTNTLHKLILSKSECI